MGRGDAGTRGQGEERILALKRLTDDACVTEKGRPFQTGIVLGKNEYLYAFTEDDRGIDFGIMRSPSLLKT